MDTREALVIAGQYAAIVARELNPDKIILYGSRADGTARDESDIDVAIIFDDFDGDWLDVSKRLSKLKRRVSLYIEPILLDSANDASGFAQEVMRTGKVLYSQ